MEEFKYYLADSKTIKKSKGDKMTDQEYNELVKKGFITLEEANRTIKYLETL